MLECHPLEYKCLTLIILNNKHFWPRQHESISVKTSMGLKTPTFSPANLFPSTVATVVITNLNCISPLLRPALVHWQYHQQGYKVFVLLPIASHESLIQPLFKLTCMFSECTICIYQYLILLTQYL